MAPFPPDPSPQERLEGVDRIGDTGEQSRAAHRAAERAALVKLVREPHDHVYNTPTTAYAEAVADAVLAAGYVRAESVASDLEDRAWQRDQDDEADKGPECDGECGNADCHRVAAVATWQRAAVQVRGSVSGGGNA